jgi:cytochrome c oxidase subunit 2
MSMENMSKDETMKTASIPRRRFLSAAMGTATAGAALLIAGTAGLAYGQGTRTIKVSAKKFVFTPSVIQVKRGETIVLELATEDVLMGFSLPGFNMRTDLIPGKVQTLKLTADKAGEYDFLCDVFCGSGHEDMSGKLIVT